MRIVPESATRGAVYQHSNLLELMDGSNKEFRVLYLQPNTTIFHLVVQ